MSSTPIMACVKTREAILRISSSVVSPELQGRVHDATGGSVRITTPSRRVAGRIELVAELPRCRPDEEVGRHLLLERLDEDLVVVALNLELSGSATASVVTVRRTQAR